MTGNNVSINCYYIRFTRQEKMNLYFGDHDNYWVIIVFFPQMLLGETPSNPLITIMDVEQYSQLGKKHDICTVLDCTFATPLLLQPIKYGIDIVWHSGLVLVI